jgi:ribonuclease HI
MASVVYTDGACRGNPGPGGWAWADVDGPWASGAEAESTNQRMELQAALEAVLAHPGELTVVSDSTYVVNCFRDKWWEGWLRRGWKNSQRQPVANRDLWEPLVEAVTGRDDVTFQWVKGHSDDPMNDLVDRLAVAASHSQESDAGDTPPQDLGPADAPATGRSIGASTATATAPSPVAPGVAADSRVPEGHRLVILGARPPKGSMALEPDVAEPLRRQMSEIIAAKAEIEPDLVVLTGLRLGVEQLGAQAAIDVGVPFVGILPYPEPDRVWSAPLRERFAELSDAARDSVTLEKKQPASRADAGAAMARRDGWLRKAADEALIVWDGTDPTLRAMVRAFEKALGDDVWVIAPPEPAG